MFRSMYMYTIDYRKHKGAPLLIIADIVGYFLPFYLPDNPVTPKVCLRPARSSQAICGYISVLVTEKCIL